MLLTEYIEVKPTAQNREYLKSKGYNTQDNKNIKILTKDLTDGSHKKVLVKCDFCGTEFYKEYRYFLEGRLYDGKDYCRKCSYLKIKNICEERYGGTGLGSKIIRSKIEETNLKRYNFKTPFESADIQKVCLETQISLYGGVGTGSKIIREKIEETNLKKFGRKNPSQSHEIKEKKKETCLKHYGVEHIFQRRDIFVDILKKSRETMCKNNTIPSSKMEYEIFHMLKDIYGDDACTHGYTVDVLTFDILLKINNIEIDIEYDGWYWHKNRILEDRKRNYKVLSLGYKILRIKSKKEIPTKEQLINAINYLINEGHNYNEIILDI